MQVFHKLHNSSAIDVHHSLGCLGFGPLSSYKVVVVLIDFITKVELKLWWRYYTSAFVHDVGPARIMMVALTTKQVVWSSTHFRWAFSGD